MKMKFICDTERCIDCDGCVTTCKNENDAYFENWVASQPKVFVMWQLREELAIPVLASVSYAKGARMLNSGDQADGLPLPGKFIHGWLPISGRTTGPS